MISTKKYLKTVLLGVLSVIALVSCSGWDKDDINLSSDPNDPLRPVASFTADETIIDFRKSITFSSTSTNSPNLYTWLFPGGSPGYSNEPNPTVFYGEDGTFNVTLRVRNDHGGDEIVMEDVVTIVKPPVELLNKTAWEIIGVSSQEACCPASQAIDGNYNTSWWASFASNYPHEFTVDMKEERLLESFVLHKDGTGYGVYGAKVHEIWISSDNITWTLATTYDGAINSAPVGVGVPLILLSVPLPTARYIKYRGVTGSVEPYLLFGELDVYAFQ